MLALQASFSTVQVIVEVLPSVSPLTVTVLLDSLGVMVNDEPLGVQ